MEKKYSYKDVFTQKEYCKVILANIISRFGDSIDALAFTWLVYQVTGSASWSAIIFAMNQLPTVVVQPFAGVWVERMKKKRLMVLTDIFRGGIIAGLVVLYLLNCINPLILVVFTLLISTVEAFRIPAGMSIIPKIIEPELLSYGSSLNSTISKVVELVGLACGGAIIGLFGVHSAILIDGITFFASALILMTLNIKEEKKCTKKFDAKAYFSDLKEGFMYLKDKEIVRNFCIMGVIANICAVPLNSLQSPLVDEVLGQGGELLSVFGIALTVGMGLGSVLLPRTLEKLSVRRIIVLSGSFIGAGMALYSVGGLFKTYVLAVYLYTALISFIVGFFLSLLSGVLGIQFIKNVEDGFLARVGAMFNAVACAAIPVASFVVSILVSRIHTSTILIAGGVLCVILFVVIDLKKVKYE